MGQISIEENVHQFVGYFGNINEDLLIMNFVNMSNLNKINILKVLIFWF